MIVYFADRQLNIVGQASTSLPKGLRIVDDLKTEDIETGVAVFDCKIAFDANTREEVEACAEVGNYILRSYDDEKEFYTIIETELDTDSQELYVYAEDAGLDLLNEIVGEYKADKEYSIKHYIDKFAAGSGFKIGINEAEELTRKLSWDGEATVTERLASVATQFGGCEISYSFEIEGLRVENMYINIYKERGKDTGAQLRLNQHVDRIVTSKTIANIGTALECVGGTPENSDKPITLSGYTYDDGDFYVSGKRLYSRKALDRWERPWGGHIVKQFSYDTTSQKELCNRAITELKKISVMEVNYEADILKFPDNVKIGDRVNIIDDAGELYLSTRLLQLETSVVNQEKKATLGEFLLKKSGISEKVEALAAKFSGYAQTSTRAYAIAEQAQAAAESAQEQAGEAVKSVEDAQAALNEASGAIAEAKQAASDAQAAADAAQATVDSVGGRVTSLEASVENAQAAAEQAQQAAVTAETKATEAHTAATNAQTKANEAAESATTAANKADTAESKADTAKSTAEQAKAEAAAASTTAAAAKLDAETAQAEINALGENLTTLSNTMTADYARKTDLTEATASLQTQITQNAEEISSTATKVTEIDETANNAAEQAQQAQTTAASAQSQAAQAKADAESAQTAANNAAAAAEQAQSEADTAKTAAATAKSVADQAKADLEAAEADLATVAGRVDATEEEIQAAQEAVNAAQSAANKAQEEAEAAEEKATTAQNTAATAVTNAAEAKTAADNAKATATAAQAAADKAQGDATAAQTKANEAAQAAAAAQSTANTAVTNAAAAQTAADQAAQEAADAKTAADNAEAKAVKAASDLATAEQNLAAVTGRVDATEEEVEAAKAAVVTAQAAADKAKADAATAQSQADKAKADAATAAQAAANAKTAADQAQADAEAAQEAADKAQSDVNALTIRVTEAETSITQNAEEIALRATKAEVTQTLGGYYTKAQADSAIEVSADGILDTVSKTYQTTQAMSGYPTTTQMNSAINQKAEAITSTVSSTYATKTALAGIETKANTALSNVSEFISGTQTAATGTWTGVSNTITELYDGLQITYWLPFAGSGNATLNLTLANGTTTGAENVYYKGSTRATTHFSAGSAIRLTYRTSVTIDGTAYTGWWADGSYDSGNYYDRTRMPNAIKLADNGTASIYVVVGTSAGYKIAKSGVTFDISYPVLVYNTSTDMKSGSTTTYMYSALGGVTLRNNVSGWTGTQYAMVYLVGTLSGKTFTIDSSVFTTTVPTSDDGKVYIPIGTAYSTYQITFKSDPTIYGYGPNGFGPISMNAQTRIEQTDEKITLQASTIAGLQEDVSALEITAAGLSSTVSSHTGSISTLQQTASGLSVSLENATSTANTAKSTADTAKSTADTAKSTADTAKSTADTAKTTATNASTTATNANTTATNAATAASNAQTTANTARTEAANAAKTATNFMSYDSTNGLLIGNKSSGSWSGNRAQVTSSAFNVLDSSGAQLASFGTTATIGKTSGTTSNVYIDSDSVDIRRGTTVLSSFSANKIDLGMDSDATVINLCGGIGSIKSTESGSQWKRMTISAGDSMTLSTAGQITLLADNGTAARHYIMVTSKTSWSTTSGRGISIFSQVNDGTYNGYSQIEAKEERVRLEVINNTENKSAYIQLEATESGENLLIDAEMWASGGLSLNGALRLDKNNQAVVGVTTGGEDRRLIVMNANNHCVINYDAYTAQHGNTNVYGNEVNIYSKGRIYTNCNVAFPNGYGLMSYLANGSTLGTMLYVNSSDNCIIGSGGFQNVYVGNTNANLYLRTDDFNLRLSPPDSGSTLDGYFYPVADGTVACGTTAHRWYRLYATSATVQTSDRRQKENIKPLGSVTKATSTAGTYARGRSVTTEETDVYSSLFDRLEPVEYNFIEGDKRKNFGLIAQDVLEVMTELGIEENELDLVHHETWIDEETGEEKDSYGIAYENLIALLIHEVQKLKGVNNEG